MPPPSKTGRSLTKQPVRPARYFPGKQVGEDPVSEEDSDEEEEEEQQAAPKEPAPKFSSFPKKATIDVRPASAVAKAPEAKAPDLEGFETASESSDGEEDGSGSEEEESSEEEDSSSDDEPKRPMLAPKFISKSKRAQQTTPVVSEEQRAEEEERKRKEKADELLQAQIEREQAARAAGKKFWDDDDAVDEVDDRDGIDPEAERAAWKLRELKRVKRDRQALIAKEQEREEVERRRNMTAEEREKEDREFLEKQQEEQEGKGKMKYMQKYFHKGAFFGADGEEQDEEVKAALNRDVAGRRFVDEASDKSVLPEYMKIRDATRLGKKGRTRYKDLKSEDTGSWGRFEQKKRDFDGVDERFRPDEKSGAERTGANMAPVGERRRRDDEAGREEKRPRYD
ncbi:hypothetical protein AC578_10995 [Pseudocercospora eumusae]|uniref:Micro-fibrillar-associated protein 1 C-terminal domain-containing protein n=1 Tax=Pseudocercospora eumusae TaxID=321146 RepID=A0A139HSQ1_9PEZI|nr:hypothetical protein AC578_10995 [Pseudocercospora eumusae]